MKTISDITQGFLALPEADVRTVLDGRRAMILAPHPDDESIGCGGLIAAACAAGAAPIVVILTDGAASHPGSKTHPPEILRELREDETRRAVKHLGLPAKNLFFLRYPDTALPNRGPGFAAAAAHIADLALEKKCGLLIAPWADDPHCDHQAGAKIAEAAAARAGLKTISYPVWGWLRPAAETIEEPRRDGWRLNIAAHRAAKHRAVAAHASQHGGLIKDSPDGFFLPENLLAIAARDFEVFIA